MFNYDHNYPSHFPPSRIEGRGINGGPSANIPGYASAFVGSPGIQGSSGHSGNERTRTKSVIDLVFENWIPFTAFVVNRFIGPRRPTADWQSPFDLDSGERIMRGGTFPSSERPFPYPYMIGMVSNMMPMQDQYSIDWAWGKNPSGPGVNTPISIPWAITYPSLPKVTG